MLRSKFTFIAHFQVPEVRTFQGLLDSGNRIRIFRHPYHRKANAVVSHALIIFSSFTNEHFIVEMKVSLLSDWRATT